MLCYSLAPRFVIGVHINSLHMEPSSQTFRHEGSLDNTPSLGVNQVSNLIDVKAQEGHGDAVLVEEDVRVGAIKKKSHHDKTEESDIRSNFAALK